MPPVVDPGQRRKTPPRPSCAQLASSGGEAGICSSGTGGCWLVSARQAARKFWLPMLLTFAGHRHLRGHTAREGLPWRPTAAGGLGPQNNLRGDLCTLPRGITAALVARESALRLSRPFHLVGRTNGLHFAAPQLWQGRVLPDLSTTPAARLRLGAGPLWSKPKADVTGTFGREVEGIRQPEVGHLTLEIAVPRRPNRPVDRLHP